jgi:hypothetical protein
MNEKFSWLFKNIQPAVFQIRMNKISGSIRAIWKIRRHS